MRPRDEVQRWSWRVLPKPEPVPFHVVPFLKVLALIENGLDIPSFAHRQRSGQQALLMGASGLGEVVRLSCVL